MSYLSLRLSRTFVLGPVLSLLIGCSPSGSEKGNSKLFTQEAESHFYTSRPLPNPVRRAATKDLYLWPEFLAYSQTGTLYIKGWATAPRPCSTPHYALEVIRGTIVLDIRYASAGSTTSSCSREKIHYPYSLSLSSLPHGEYPFILMEGQEGQAESVLWTGKVQIVPAGDSTPAVATVVRSTLDATPESTQIREWISSRR